MVKICPKCSMKNFDDTRLCEKCLTDISNLPILKEKVSYDNYSYFTPRGMQKQPYEGRIYSKIGLSFATLFFVLLVMYFYLPILLAFLFYILVILAIFTPILGKVASHNGDEMLGKFTFFIGILSIIITFAIFIKMSV